MNIIVIHPHDRTTDFLTELYKDELINKNITWLNENDSDGYIRSVLKQRNTYKRVMILGHGNENGLFSRPVGSTEFDRVITNSQLLPLLKQKDKEFIGIWCNANLFANRFKLKGLFSGMIISELKEAYTYNIQVSQKEINKENKSFAKDLSYCLKNYDLEEIPEQFKKLNTRKTEISNFNYNNIYYVDGFK